MMSKLRWVAPIRAILVSDAGIGMNSSAMIAYVYGRKIKMTAANLLSPFISRLEETRSPLNCAGAIDQQSIQWTLPGPPSGLV
jgi:hypothetical protein